MMLIKFSISLPRAKLGRVNQLIWFYETQGKYSVATSDVGKTFPTLVEAALPWLTTKTLGTSVGGNVASKLNFCGNISL